ncbi:TPA: hypothetical protein H1005_02840 [archaeon]|nr:hypothetical protein [Candidatus Naiadarchaeales archaeon SRR2090153.bin1042]
MKSLNKLLVISLLAIVLIFSGCIGGGDRKNQTFGSGLNVISFTALRQVDSAEQFDLDLVVQNIGDKDATNIQADLFQTSAITILNNRVQTESRLLPPDIEKGIEGEDTIFSWSLQAPTLTEDQTKSLQARITYDYTSTATSNLYIVSKT